MYKEKFTPKEWNEIRDEVFYERFQGDYSNYINPKEPEEFKPKTEDEELFFKEAYEEYRNKVCYDRADEEIFREIDKKMVQKGYIVTNCPHCNEIHIFKNVLS